MQQGNLQRLLELGFKKVGHWKLSDAQRLRCELSTSEYTGKTLYTFVSSSHILYIGKTNRTLKRRMYGYMNPGKSQRTNHRLNPLLTRLLSDEKQVEIYAFADSGLLFYGGFHVNLAAGLEDSLISQIRPKWNMMGKSRITIPSGT